jgi:hypothetical protein
MRHEANRFWRSKSDHAEAAEERGGKAKVGRNSECRTPNSVLQTMCYHPGRSPGLSPAKNAYPERTAQRLLKNAEGRQNGDDFIGQSGLGGLGSSDPPGAPPKKATPGRITQRPLRNAEELRFGVRVPGSPHFDFRRLGPNGER